MAWNARRYTPFTSVGVDHDVAPDGRFPMIKLGDAAVPAPEAAPTITIVTHWLDELRARVR